MSARFPFQMVVSDTGRATAPRRKLEVTHGLCVRYGTCRGSVNRSQSPLWCQMDRAPAPRGVNPKAGNPNNVQNSCSHPVGWRNNRQVVHLKEVL